MKFFLIFFSFIIVLQSAELPKKNFYSKDEIKYLQDRDNIVACIYTVLQEDIPVSNKKDLTIGFDIIDLLQKHINIPIKIRVFNQLDELHKSAINRECDMIPLMEKTKKRKHYFNFTKPYFSLPVVMATKSGMPFINDISLLGDRKIAAVKGHSFIEKFQDKYPNLNLVIVQTREEALDKLRKEEVFGYLDFPKILNYIFVQKEMNDISITAQFDELSLISVALRNDKIELLNIFENAIKLVDKKEIERIFQQWYQVKYERRVDNKLLLQLIFYIIVIVAIFIYWYLHLKEDLAKEEEKQFLLMRQSKFAQMGEMIENIAHQWRQPLAQINSNIWVLSLLFEEEKLSKKEKILKQFQEIEDVTQYMSKTIDDFKDFFHPKKIKELFFLEQAFENSLLILKGNLKSNKIELEFFFDKNLKVHSFLKELEHVIVILLNNAKEALIVNKITKPTIKVYGFYEKDYLVIKICDNAKGIDLKYIHKIFDPYFTSKHQNKNTGLGLYMAKMIVEKTLNGKLSAYNENKGACFIIKIPKGENLE